MGDLLRSERILGHAWVTGELMLGGQPRSRLADLELIEQAPIVSTEEQQIYIQAHRLWHRRVGWVDTQLLASCKLAGARLWTRDRALDEVARALDIGFAHA